MSALALTTALVALVAGVLLGGAQVRAVAAARQVQRRLAGAGATPSNGARPSEAPGPSEPVRAAEAVRPSWPAPVVLAIGAAGLVAAAMAAGPQGAALLALAGVAVPATAQVRQRAARRHARARQLPEALDRLASSLRSGASLSTALGEAGDALPAPIGPELAGVAAATRRGTPVHAALDDWSTTHDDPGTRLAATALVLADVVGSAPARALDGAAATLRERLDLAGERRALAAQARTSSLVLSIAPVCFAAVLVLADTAAAGFLLGSAGGAACLAAGVALDALGAWWMARLCRSDAA